MERDRAVSYYIKVAETLKARIRHGQYQPNDLIPSARKLEEEFKVSNITIRKALDLLTREGFVIPMRGVGTRVVKIEDDVVSIEITGSFRDWVDSAIGRNLQLTVDVLEITITSCPKRVSQILTLGPDENIWRMKRVRKLRGVPMSYIINYGRPELFDGKITKQEVEKRSFVDLFQELCQIRLSKMKQRVEATVADMDLSDLLNINFGDPLFFVENIYYSTDGPAEVTHMYYRGDKYVYDATIRLNKKPD
ncbi:MAG: GntR family transcriptional regulator [Pseudomonadota bacterium]